ncbi:MAG: hypothetical protein KAS90_04450 [Candidatus Aenigmarchaeota archaeon]|nr:hypothetical protein [Candidatus Aenigmarchaeota archaeon]
MLLKILIITKNGSYEIQISFYTTPNREGWLFGQRTYVLIPKSKIVRILVKEGDRVKGRGDCDYDGENVLTG